MSSKLPDILRWSARQIEYGLVKDNLIARESNTSREMTSLEIRNSLALLKLDALRGFSIVSQRVKLKGTILQISMYQTVLNHIKIG